MKNVKNKESLTSTKQEIHRNLVVKTFQSVLQSTQWRSYIQIRIMLAQLLNQNLRITFNRLISKLEILHLQISGMSSGTSLPLFSFSFKTNHSHFTIDFNSLLQEHSSFQKFCYCKCCYHCR